MPDLTVRIVRDTASPLWVIRCVAPCGLSGPERLCQGDWRADEKICWLGGYGSEDAARRIAESHGYRVTA